MAGNCLLINHEVLTWHDARSHCLGLGGDLASIPGAIDQTYISAMVMDTSSSFWVGGSNVDKSSGWKWSDGSAFAHFYWNENQPSDHEDSCVEFVADNSRWNDGSCVDLRASICKKRGEV
ncbi:hypothetical protein CAPTEDRAFT_92673 [Capitella teleta]|uniref:C-type lectin domain-containing protein n=1 Tax=Capitella teleta TaxID=283909 RepID=R7T7X3_CAPTE|nr:hypothetical protein CAPTEDRAFT_92673 [Capitella teleta]|eukprot:ELT87525.1 hypothetical protein CAPTEDRAFT_92673 [Capitella teleta]